MPINTSWRMQKGEKCIWKIRQIFQKRQLKNLRLCKTCWRKWQRPLVWAKHKNLSLSRTIKKARIFNLRVRWNLHFSSLMITQQKCRHNLLKLTMENRIIRKKFLSFNRFSNYFNVYNFEVIIENFLKIGNKVKNVSCLEVGCRLASA